MNQLKKRLQIQTKRFIFHRYRRHIRWSIAPIFVAFGAIDYMYRPDLTFQWVLLRVLFWLFTFLCFELLKNPYIRNNFSEHIAVITILACASIVNLMIYQSGGHTSLYITGMFLVSVTGTEIFRLSKEATLITHILIFGITILILFISVEKENELIRAIVPSSFFIGLTLLSWIFRSTEDQVSREWAETKIQNEEELKQQRDMLFDLNLNLEKRVQESVNKIKKQQAELLQSAKLASIGTLAAGIAHELNNSLSLIKGVIRPLTQICYSEIKLKENKDLKEIFEIVRSSLDYSFKVINGIYNFSGINQAKTKNVDLSNILENILILVHSRIKKRDICLNVEKETIWMLTDIIGINQIFMNVIVNAIDAVEEKGKIDITLFEKNDLVNFIVKDNGCGIPKGKEERLFDPFFTTKVVGSGIGLGLYIVKREVDKLNGRINLSKNNNKGTLFTITIPKL